MEIRMVIAAWPVQAPRGAVAAFCRAHGMSRSRFYEIRAQAAARGPLEAVTPVRRARPDLATPAAVVAAALRIRKELAEDGWDHGPLSVRHEMVQAGLPAPSRATLARIFSREGVVVAQPQKRPHAAYRSFVFEQVHQCWQLDATEWRLADGQKVVVFQMLDDHSRYVLASVVACSENSDAAVEVMRAAVTAAGRAPVLLLSDNSVAINPHRRGKTSDLVRYALDLGTRPITSRAYHPQTCGKNERLHSTLKKFLRARPLPACPEELRGYVALFDDRYNHRRPHQRLGMRYPAQVLATSPHADPPPPPEPPPTSTGRSRPRRIPGTPGPHDRLRVLRVKPTGSVRVAGVFIHLGAEHAGSDVLALREAEAQVVSIFDTHGNELRTVHLTPGTTYYGTGRPAGGRRRTRLNDTITPDN